MRPAAIALAQPAQPVRPRRSLTSAALLAAAVLLSGLPALAAYGDGATPVATAPPAATAAPATAAPPGSAAAPAPNETPAAREHRQPAPESFLARGLAMLARPRPEDQAEAQRLLRKALKAKPDLAAAHAGLSRSFVYLYTAGIDERPETLAQAMTEAEAAVAAGPGSAAAHAALAMALAASDRLTPALAEADAAAGAEPASFEGHLARCVVARLRRDLEASLAACRQAADIAPDEPRVLLALAESLREAGDLHVAVDLFGQVTDLDHESVLSILGAATAFVRVGQFRAASYAYDTLLEKHPFVRQRTYQSAAGMRIVQSDWEGALELYERITLPENGSPPTLLSLYGKGYALLRLERAAEAEYFLSLLVARVPKDYDGPARGRDVLFRAFGDLADFHAARNRPDRVEAVLRDAVSRPGAPTRLARRLADLPAVRANRSEAAAILGRALEGADRGEDPIEIAETALAWARQRPAEGRLPKRLREQAGRMLGGADDRVPEDAPGAAHYRLARAWALMEEPERSLECLVRARASGYLPAEAAQEPDFAILKSDPAFQKLFTP